MKNEQILKKAIEKAVKNGWVPKVQWKANPELYQSAIIFSHNFAKAFWGEKNVDGRDGSPMDDRAMFLNSGEAISAWKFHLQQIVLKKDPIKYLEKFI